LAGNIEGTCTEKWLVKLWQERYYQKTHEKGFKRDLELYGRRFGRFLISFVASNQGKGTENLQKGLRSIFLKEVAA